MKKRITLKDVARAANVHVSTASRALDPNTSHPIRDELALHIRRVSAELGYELNAEAYSLRTRRTRLVGVVIPDITDPVYPLILRGLENALLPRRFVSIVASLDGDMSREADVTALMRSRNVDGLILGSVEREDVVATKLLSQGVPLVTVGRRVENESVSSVTSDHVEGIRQALAHLRALGHRAIAHIAGPQKLSTGADRLKAFRGASAALGLGVSERAIVAADAYSIDEGRRCARELVARATGTTAVVCANDRLAVGAIAALRELGLECPRDLSVTGYNDMPMVDLLSPGLTTVHVPLVEIGSESARLLLDLLDRPEPEREARHVVLPASLVVRGSTRPPPP
ncbi:LacI family DNA-binding transcriptional regulator [Propylenella binzhouense]|uniref:LacI family transcriptional regulator n=1 Tax=Propylenella binzhouense TaxID=2555902 RepID=A0A964WSA5_9HYPH|nr:LacI family DNA-binding transcriptional regulator [Propylenella binzhouense]MYZ46773.1 LacI family transcriptional regulator [Propylenella binzhouense]